MIYKIHDFIEELTKKYTNTEDDTENTKLPAAIKKVTVEIKDTSDLEDLILTQPSKLAIFKPSMWPESKFFFSKYQIKYKAHKKTDISLKMEAAEKLKITDIKPLQFANAITHMGIKLLKDIHPSEFIDYGNNECCGIEKWIKFNTALEKYISQNLDNIKYFLKVAEELKGIQNYDGLKCIVNALLQAKISDKMYEKLCGMIKSDYFALRKEIEERDEKFYILPLDIFLKDLEDSNRNLNSEFAGRRFVELMKTFVDMQEVNWHKNFKLKNKLQHFLFVRLFEAFNGTTSRAKKFTSKKNISKELGSIFLFL